jgi:hypothetical protein
MIKKMFLGSFENLLREFKVYKISPGRTSTIKVGGGATVWKYSMFQKELYNLERRVSSSGI